MGEILVRGEVQRRVEPTEASVTVVVRAQHGADAATAIDEAGRRCAAVDAAVEAHREAPVVAVRTAALRTGKEWEHTQKGRRMIGWSATRTTVLTCAPDGPGLTALVDALGRLEGVSLSGPDWHVAPDADALRQVRADAAADAARRAEDYARGLGRAVGSVVWISEPGLRIAGGGVGADMGAPMAAMSRSMAGGGGPEDEPVPVTVVVEPLPVQVRVEAAFTLLDG